MNDYEEFQKEYTSQHDRYELLLLQAKKDLCKGLKKVRVSRELPIIRIRLIEHRVKDCLSLYRKAQADKVNLRDALNPSISRDLMGLRVVVNNLSDIEAFMSIVGKGDVFPFAMAQRNLQEKRWIEKGQPGTGYRGWHCDVSWLINSKQKVKCFAELQCRTVLQDAWATLMHDDVHKPEIGASLGDRAKRQLELSSDFIYTLDRMAGELRITVEERIVEGSRIRVQEAIDQQMFSLASFQMRAIDCVPYKRMERHDTYQISRSAPRFEFEVHGECIQKTAFAHVLVGDTAIANCQKLSIMTQEGQNSPWRELKEELDFKKERIDDLRIVLRCKAKKLHHHYKITCIWHGVFDEKLEYVWCPWNVLYKDAKGEYRITLKGRDAIQDVPKVFNIADFESLAKLRQSLPEIGEQMRAEGRQYTWSVCDPRGTPCAFFQIS